MHPQWRCRGSKIEYRIARPRADSGRGELGCVGHGGTYQSLGKHCESLPAEVPVQPDAGSPVRSRGRRSRACDESSRPILLRLDRKSTRLNSSHLGISYAVFCLKKKKKQNYMDKHTHTQERNALLKAHTMLIL